MLLNPLTFFFHMLLNVDDERKCSGATVGSERNGEGKDDFVHGRFWVV